MKTKYFFTLLLILTLFSVNKSAIAQNSSEEIFSVVEAAPTFVGGDEARIKFISKNLKYPSAAIDQNIQGTVYVSFVVETDGSITNVTLKRDIGGGCGEEAMRVVKLMPKWNPGKQKGKFVRVQFILPIKFILN
jgi:protein TonB